MHAPRSLAAFGLVVLVICASCLPGARAPDVKPQRTLELGKDPALLPADGPFAVVFAAPRGPTEDPTEVSVVFNRPMRALETAGDERSAPAQIAAVGSGRSPKGVWKWLGTQAVIFVPDAPLPRATEFAVTVPAGTKALDGSALAEAYAFQFATPRPRLVGSEPYDGATHLKPGAFVELRFDQPVATKEVERAVSLAVASSGRVLPFRASVPKTDTNGTLVRLTPQAPLPLDTDLRVVLDPSLRGKEGALPAGDRRTLRLRTYGPLTVARVDCYRETPHRKCAPYENVRLELSNSVPLADVQKYVRVDPPLPLTWSKEEAGAKTSYVSVPASFKPGRSYRVTVKAGLRDEYGQALPRDLSFPVEVDDLWPHVEMGLEGSVFEASFRSKRGRPREVPITSVNTASYDVVATALDEATTARLAVLRSEGRDAVLFREAEKVPGAKVRTVTPGGAKNMDVVERVNLDDLLAKSRGRGAALVGVRSMDRSGRQRHDVRIVSVSDLALSAKVSRFGSVAWVTRFDTGEPVAGATVAVRDADGKETASFTTDAQGLATLPAERFQPYRGAGSEMVGQVLFARTSGDSSFVRTSDTLSPWRYDVPNDPAGDLRPQGILFTDRGVYRPGETVKVRGIFRVPTAKGTETPRGRTVRLTVSDGGGEKLFEEEKDLDGFGAFAADVALPPTAHLGDSELRAEVLPPKGQPAKSEGDEDDRYRPSSAMASVLLAAYKASEFKVSVDADKPAYVRGEKANFTVRGDYLFGAPMTTGKVRYSVTRGSAHFAIPGLEDAVTDDDTYAWDLPDATARGGEVASGEGALDGRGGFPVATALALPGQRGTETVTLEAEVEDVSRQALSGRSSVIVHPGDFYVGLKPPKDFFVEKGKALEPDLFAVDPEGKARSGVPLKLELVRRVWRTVVEASGDSGSHYESRTVDTTVASCAATSGPKAVRCSVVAPEPGYYLLRARGKDGRGNELAASSSIYVIGDGASAGWAMNDVTRVDLVTDKKLYEIGDTARILVKNPFPEAEALVTVERAGVLHKERVHLSGPTPTLKIPITDEMRPNAFVAVHIVRGRSGDAPAKGADVAAPAFRLGYASLVVNPEARRLKVAVTPSKREAKPGDTLDVDIAVADRAGKAVRTAVTFYAVDEGVLLLTGYKTPDPVPVFTAPRPLSVLALEAREDLARLVVRRLGEGGAEKGDEGGGGGEVRADFRATAYFEPSLVTNAEGKAHVRFKLPDGVTTYRLMAVVAAEDDRFGFGESQVQTSRSLMLRPALPRFLRAGDDLEAGIVVSTKGIGARTVEVTLDVEGLALKGAKTRSIAVPANGSVEVRWAMHASAGGTARFTFRGKSGDATDAVVVPREVQVPASLETVAFTGDTTTAVAERLGDLTTIRSDVGGLDVRVASTALLGLSRGADQLVEYPYGCTEQLTSRLVPLVPLRALAAELGIVLPKNLGPVIGETLAKILKNQQDDGSFGYWSDSPKGDDWLTAYVLWALDIAKKNEHPVPDGAMERATDHLRNVLKKTDEDTISLATRAFVLDVLATVGSPDAGAMTRLYERREKLPFFGRALLAHAYALGKGGEKARDELLRDVEAHLRITNGSAVAVENEGAAYAPILDSNARTTAMVLRALIAASPKTALGPRLAKGILDAREGGRWRSTQEAAWALLALDDYRRAQEPPGAQFDARVFFGADLAFEAKFDKKGPKEQRHVFPAARLAGDKGSGANVAFQLEGAGHLFYEGQLRYAKKEMPTDTLDRGFYIRKIVRALKPADLAGALRSMPEKGVTRAQGSDLVLVDLLVVTATPREQVVIDDPLPAGVEPVDSRLSTTSRRLAEVESDEGRVPSDDEDEDGRRYGGYSSAYYHREMHDDRVLTFVEHMAAGLYHYRYVGRATTFGTFVVPPTRAECMYEPATFGRTGATTFSVGATP